MICDNDNHMAKKMKGLKRARQNGSVLLMSIILSSGIMIVGIEFSLFVVSSLSQQKSIDQTVVAQYASESGAEDALEQVRREFPTTGATTLRSDSLTSPAVVYADGARGGSWTYKKPDGSAVDPQRFNTQIDQLTKTYLGEQQSVDINVYTNTGSGFTSATASLQKMNISWDAQDCSNGGDTTWIETTATFWPINGTNVDWSQSTTAKSFLPSPSDSAPSSVTVDLQDLSGGGPIAGRGMTLRIKPFYCSLHNVRIIFPDATDPTKVVPIPNYYLMKPAGFFGSTEKDIRIIAPQQGASSGIFDYTIFSDEQLTKQSGL